MIGLLTPRNKEKEADFLSSDDISMCPICGNNHMWVGWGKGQQTGIITSLNCTHCGWACDDTNKFITFFTHIFRAKNKDTELYN